MPSYPGLRDICLDTVLSLIFESLSASSAASFLTIVESLKLPFFAREYFKRTYVRPIRDIPEYNSWIEACVSKGHRVFLIGSDLELWWERLFDPAKYWERYPAGFMQERPLRLWLAVRVSHSLHKQPQLRNPRKNIEYWVTRNGDAVTGGRALSALYGGTISTKSNLIPLPGDARSRNSRLKPFEEYRWHLASKRNEHNISLVWAEVKSNNQAPHVQMCPLQASARSSTDIMGGNHGFLCTYQSPGSIVRPSPYSLRQVIPKVPYLDIGSGEPATASSIDHGDNPESFAIIIKLDCHSSRSQPGKVLGPAIRGELQGIPW